MGIQMMPSTTSRLMPNAREHIEVQHGASLPTTDGSSTLMERTQAVHSCAPICNYSNYYGRKMVERRNRNGQVTGKFMARGYYLVASGVVMLWFDRKSPYEAIASRDVDIEGCPFQHSPQ